VDWSKVVSDVFSDLILLASSSPNERLPKEEQIRSRVFATIRPWYQLVCVERGYASIDEKGRVECDLWARTPGRPDAWIEMKRCWYAKGWVNKPPEKLAYWTADIEKLGQVGTDSDRFFLLIGLFDLDLLAIPADAAEGVLRNILGLHSDRCVFRASMPYWWREENITHVGAWVWHWRPGVMVKDIS